MQPWGNAIFWRRNIARLYWEIISQFKKEWSNKENKGKKVQYIKQENHLYHVVKKHHLEKEVFLILIVNFSLWFVS